MSIVMKPSKPFSSGTEYEIFMDSFCSRCKDICKNDSENTRQVENFIEADTIEKEGQK